MDLYMGSSFEDLVVPKHQESFDTFASPDAWSRWGISSPEAPDKCFIMDGCDVMNCELSGGFYCQFESGTCEESNELNFPGDFCSGSSLQELRDDHSQLHDFNGIEQMDDIFLDSILEDVPRNGSLHTSFCSISPSSELRLKPEDKISLADTGLDGQSFSSSKSSVDTSAYVDTLSAFHPLVGLHSSEVPVSPFILCNSGRYQGMHFKPPFTISDPSEENSSNLNFSEDPSLQEFVLQDLQRVVEKLADKTRICFRDTFYRLSKTSQQKLVSPGTNPEDFAMETPCKRNCGEQGERIRSRRKQATESGTNTIDRAVANLTFNKMESNICKFPLPGKVNPNPSIAVTMEPQNPKSDNLTGVAEVPVVFKRNPEKKLSRSGSVQ